MKIEIKYKNGCLYISRKGFVFQKIYLKQEPSIKEQMLMFEVYRDDQ